MDLVGSVRGPVGVGSGVSVGAGVGSSFRGTRLSGTMNFTEP